MKKLTNGLILSDTTCPYSKEYGSAKITACNGKGCPISDNKIIEGDFSCALARGLDMIHANN